jgi:hypothetical protein
MLARLRRRRTGVPPPTVVRDYGRDSLLVWTNLLLGPLFARLGLRIGLRSEDALIARIEADATAMRGRGYFVVSTETFALPVIGFPDVSARWYRITYELAGAPTSEGPTAVR